MSTTECEQIVDIAPYLANRDIQTCTDLAQTVAQTLHSTGMLVIRDPRVQKQDNETFLDLMERYACDSNLMMYSSTGERSHCHHQYHQVFQPTTLCTDGGCSTPSLLPSRKHPRGHRTPPCLARYHPFTRHTKPTRRRETLATNWCRLQVAVYVAGGAPACPGHHAIPGAQRSTSHPGCISRVAGCDGWLGTQDACCSAGAGGLVCCCAPCMPVPCTIPTYTHTHHPHRQ